MATHSDYKALVYVYLSGGLSTWQTLIAETDYSLYASRRAGTAIPLESALPIPGTAAGKSFRLHPSLPLIAGRFNASSPAIKSAIIHNIGPLNEPTTKAQYLAGTVDLPYQLFSHSDQTAQVQTAIPYVFGFGWGGRVADYFLGANFTQSLPVNITIAGIQTFSRGQDANPYAVTSGGALRPKTLNGSLGGTITSAATALIANSAMSGSPNTIARLLARTIQSSVSLETVYNSAVSPISGTNEVTTTFPGSPLGSQLKQVARQIKARAALNPSSGNGRDIFFVQMGGFDTHAGEDDSLPGLLSQVDAAINAFLTEIELIGVQNNVMVVEQSDFGRTLTVNGAGTDHAWGTFCFVWGGSVIPGHYGTPPNLAVDSSDDVGQGRYIPTIATSQLAASVAEWLGVPTVNLNALFPTLENFPTQTIPFIA